jgi:hypothetical protein
MYSASRKCLHSVCFRFYRSDQDSVFSVFFSSEAGFSPGAIRLVGMEPLPKEPKAAPASKQTSAAGEKPASEEKKTEKTES